MNNIRCITLEITYHWSIWEKSWRKNDKRHRADGPARISIGGEQYWENGSLIVEKYKKYRLDT